jgi:serpin B
MPPTRSLTVLAGLILFAGCASDTEPTREYGQTLVESTPLLEALPRPLTAAEQALIRASNGLSFSLFHQINTTQKDSNTFVSPLSVSMALAMMLDGTTGSTATQIRSVLSLDAASTADVNTGYRSLMTLLHALDPMSDIGQGSSLWYRSGIPVNQPFVDASTSAIGAQVTGVDFTSQSTPQTINTWADNATQGKVSGIVTNTSATQGMLLLSAASFRGTWRTPFDAARTGTAQFHAVSGIQLMRMMTRGDIFRYYASDVFEAVDLPYGNGAYSMTIALPRAGTTIDAAATSLQSMGDAFWAENFRAVPMQLFLPHFRIEWDHVLNDDLKALGIADAFTTGVADFTPMSTQGHTLSFDTVKQKTYIDVEEEGNGGAAIIHPPAIDGPGAVPFPLIMFVDRPFMIVIREHLSGTIIFMGKVTHVS